MYNKFSLLIMLAFLIASCKKEKAELSVFPSIEFISISPTTAQQYSDTITIKIKYSDADGDLGENTSSAENCFITDTRNGIIYSYRIKQLAPTADPIAITGTLDIKLSGQYIIGNGNSEQVSYSIFIKDRSGNESNHVSTSAITITR